ncbi:GNAT family N-acetyltransferase [Actinomadura atramentaria]|uniref:GNAT family N-acetyltransferase n=1 Tax=Actinomadura atramentaria TaxID=1990 RepID=UPI0003A83253|nr:GNAT family N-acetyltransferase [Actinomadura atramentaria]
MTRIEQVDPADDRRYAEFHDAYEASHDLDCLIPWTAREKRVLLEPDPYERCAALLARDDAGRVVGGGSATLPRRDNLTFAYLQVWTLPDRRREGHATAVLAALEDAARAAGRTKALIGAASPVGAERPAAPAFAAARGYEFDLRDAVRELPLPADPPDAPVDPAYRLASWPGVIPDAYVAEWARLRHILTEEAPSGDAGIENEHWDAERVRHQERLRERQGRDAWVTVAVAPDGTLAGHTELSLPRGSDEAHQWDTLVLPEHRGHGLGLAMKAANLRAAAPLLAGRRRITTWNAASNAPMIAVNEALGFRLIAWEDEYVKRL